MKTPQLSLGPDGIKGLLVQHVEKFVFGLAVLLVLVFVYLGINIESYDSSKTPDELKSLAVRATSHINESNSTELLDDRVPREGRGGQYERRVNDASLATDPSAYKINVPWVPPAGKPGSKREDPELFKPLELETYAFTGAICLQAEAAGEGALAELDYAEPRKEDRPKRRKRQRRPRGGGSGGMMSGPPGGMMSGAPGGADGGMMSGPPGGMMSGAPGDGMEGMPGFDPGSGRDRRGRRGEDGPTVIRRYPASEVCGYRPGGRAFDLAGGGDGSGMMSGPPGGMMSGEPGGGMMSGDPGTMMSGPPGGMMSGPPGMGSGGSYGQGQDSGSGVTGQGPARAESRHVVIVKALAPYRKQADEYERVLGNAIGYDPRRDRPRLIFFQAQRADVTDDPTAEPDESQWKSIMNPKKARQLMNREKWHGTLAEVADSSYVDPNVTMPAPPIMLRCLEEYLLHEEVPKATMRTVTAGPMQPGQEPGEGDQGAEGTSEGPSDGDLPGGNMPGGMAGRGGFGSSMPGMGSMGSGAPGMGMSGPPMGSGAPGMGMSGPPMGSGAPGMGMSGPPMGSGMGSGMGYMGGSASMEPVQYKLVRFFDMEVEPGRVYKYRVRLFYEDPNNPNTDPQNGLVMNPPARRTLADSVLQRLQQQEQDPATKNAYYVITDWSTASQPVTLPAPARMYVGQVSPPRYANGVGGTQVPQSEPRGEVVPVDWYEDLAIDVSDEQRAYRGSYFDYTDDFEVLDPITLAIRLLEDYRLRNGYLVLDLRGGEDLPGDREKRVESAGEYALLDDEGNFVVRNELDDYQRYRRFTFADEPRTRTGAGGSGFGMPGMSGPPDMGSGPGVSGPPGMGVSGPPGGG
jgi:hypothetical protein